MKSVASRTQLRQSTPIRSRFCLGIAARATPGNPKIGPVGHRSSYHYRRRALPTFARYPAGMAKARLRKPDGRKSKAPADDAIVRDDGSALPPKKPPAPSPKHRCVGRRCGS
jgi:hypothetical protein